MIHFVKTGAYSHKLIEWLHLWLLKIPSLCFYSSCSVTKSTLTLWELMNYSTPGSSVLHYFPEFAQIHVHWVVMVMLSNHFILCHILLLLSSIFTIIKVFLSESALLIRWPKYWSFSFSISLLRVDFFRFDWFDLVAGKEFLSLL